MKYEERLGIIEMFIGPGEESKKLRMNIYERYADVAEAFGSKPGKKNKIDSHIKTFQALCYEPILLISVLQSRNQAEFLEAASNSEDLRIMFRDTKNIRAVMDKLKQHINYPESKEYSIVEIKEALLQCDFQDSFDIIQTEPEEHTGNETSHLIPDVEELIVSILNRNEAVFRSSMELDRPYGMLYEDGLLGYHVSENKLHFVKGEGKGESLFENLYGVIIKGAGVSLRTAGLREIPDSAGMEETNADYYPGFMFRYALGMVDDKNYSTWPEFKVALRDSLSKRFKKLYDRGIFFRYLNKIEKIYSTALLVINYEAGLGIKLRISLPGVRLSAEVLETAIRSVMTYRNAGITITKVSGYEDVADVQILQDEDGFLDRPYWAYKAMKLRINTGEKISLSEGLPIGRKVNGEIVDFKLDPANRFLTFIAAGSGAGKGVLTLSIVAAAIGGGIPLFYMDFKPDMAPIFWDIEKKYDIHTFTYDAMTVKCANDTGYVLGKGMPATVEREFGRFSGAILYLKAVQLMCAIAKYRTDSGVSGDILFIFDETQAMQRLIKSAVEKAVELKKKFAPKNNTGEDNHELYDYMVTFLDWVRDINTNIDTYVNTTGRKSNTFCIFIAQSPDYGTWNNLKAKTDNGQLELLSRITFADTIFKILGRGATTSKYGLGGDGKKSITPKELKYVANNRFFGMYDGKTTDGADINVFKPFLTLNTDDPFDKCWTKGMGQIYGCGKVTDEEYVKNIAKEHPGEEGFLNRYGIHTGTGLEGLAGMYCGGNPDKISKGFTAGWEYCNQFFRETGLNLKYESPTEYMYDMSCYGLLTLDEMLKYDHKESNDYKPDMEEVIDTGWDVNTEINQRHTDRDIDITEDTIIRDVSEEVPVNDKKKEADDPFYDKEGEGAYGLHVDLDADFDDSREYRVFVETGGIEALESSGRDGKRIRINTKETVNVIRLNDENSINCRLMGNTGSLSLTERLMVRTPGGAERYVARLWKLILKSIISMGYLPAIITRVSLHGGQMYINGKIVLLDGILGGKQNIRLRDIVNYKILFEKFPMIKELRLDEDMLKAALAEIGRNAIEKMFSSGKKLEMVYVKLRDGSTKLWERQEIEDEQLRRLLVKNEFESDMDVYCKCKHAGEWGRQPAGDSIWGMKIAKASLSKAGVAFMDGNKLGVGRTVAYGSVGIAAGILGFGLWGVSRGIKGLLSLSLRFGNHTTEGRRYGINKKI